MHIIYSIVSHNSLSIYYMSHKQKYNHLQKENVMSWENVLGIITHPAVILIVTTVAGFAVKGFTRYKKAFNEIVDIPRAVLKARGHKSVGGATITGAEYEAIGKEIVEALEQLGLLYTARSK